MNRNRFFTFFATLATIAFTSTSRLHAAEADDTLTHTLRPDEREFSEDRLKQLKLRSGFEINVFAKGMGNARMLLVADDGTVYLTQNAEGQLSSLKDSDGDGKADKIETLLTGIEGLHGLAIHDNYLYLVSTKKLMRAPLDSVKGAKPEDLGKELPDGGQHGRRTLGFGPDGKLYLSIGSSCNNCEETNPEHATLLQVNPQTWERRVFAKGLRNTIGFAWHPETKQLWGMDHGSDDRGDDLPPEELNELKEGSDYGWPFCYGQNIVDRKANEPHDKSKKEERCAKATPPTLEYQAHSAPIGMAFYTGSQFPSEYRNDAFVAMRGSWNRKPASGYKIVRIHFKDGKPVEFQDFVSGFLIEGGKAHFGRVAGIAVAKDGSLLFTDDTNGIIYRVAYKNRKP